MGPLIPKEMTYNLHYDKTIDAHTRKNRLGTDSGKIIGGGGGEAVERWGMGRQSQPRETSPLTLVQLQITNICSIRSGVLCVVCEASVVIIKIQGEILREKYISTAVLAHQSTKCSR